MCHKYYDGLIEYLYAVTELSTKLIIISSNPHTISEIGYYYLYFTDGKPGKEDDPGQNLTGRI